MTSSPIRPVPQYGYSQRPFFLNDDNLDTPSLDVDDNDFPTSYSAYSSRPESPLNLGAESPGSILKPALTPAASSHSLSSLYAQWSKITGTVQGDNASNTRSRLWRSASFLRKKAETVQKMKRADSATDYCGICFEPAVQPRKMRCCGSVFCLEHISNWLYAPSADGCCPTCKKSYVDNPNGIPTPPPEIFVSDSDATSSDSGDLTPSTSADEAAAAYNKRKAESMNTPSVEEYDKHTYERFIFLVGITIVMFAIVGYN